MLSEDLERAIAEMVAIGEVAPDADPAALEDLVVMHARDLEGLETLTSLRTLSLIGCSAGDYRRVGRLPSLRLLAIEHSDLVSLDGVLPVGVQVVVVRNCRLSSVAPADVPTGLQVIDVSGNPLDDAAAAVVDDGVLRGAVVTRDDDRVLALNARLARADGAFVCAGAADACILTVSGLDITPHPERVHVSTTTAEVDIALSTGALRALAGIE
ncbi:hypothetical protein [Microbacterium sp. Root180]|uniref:hypothetical protein n=1 Tax=Microbacterium sp. Root180 TaxID=1736483 RepID=UPI0007148D84|nr:hypothetical protein [Microbacterium sp. Root180]KRB37858.1 hypothetical protein ASD93_05900 [Microbacterium sp. Root180]